MNRRVLLIVLGFVSMLAHQVSAQEGEIRRRVMAELVEFVTTEGFAPTVDSDGDIAFKVEGRYHYIVVYDEELPYYINFVRAGFKVGGADGFDKEKSLVAANNVNIDKRGVKVTVTDSVINFVVQTAYHDTESFKRVFYRLLAYLEAGQEGFIAEYNALVDSSK